MDENTDPTSWFFTISIINAPSSVLIRPSRVYTNFQEENLYFKTLHDGKDRNVVTEGNNAGQSLEIWLANGRKHEELRFVKNKKKKKIKIASKF